MINSKVAKEEMQREITELRRTNMLSIQIFDALRSDRQVLLILKMLKGEEDPSLIADVANSSQGTQFNINPLLDTNEDTFQDTRDSRTYESVQAKKQSLAPIPNQINYFSTIAPCHQLLIQHLLTLYWTWIHPAHPLFSMEYFLQDYMTGTERHSSAFLVAAVCAAACDLLSPPWINMLGKGFDVATLRLSLVAEASKQETLADPNAQTTLKALQVMKIVGCRSETPYRLTSAGARPHLMHDFRAITIISFDAIEAYIHRYYI